jgi:hypothetical protein
LALEELSVMEQRYRAELEVEAGYPVTEVATRHGLSGQSVHAWGVPLSGWRHQRSPHTHRMSARTRSLPVLAGTLTRHLMWEILVRGAGG